MTPTIEQVKEHFKNALEIRCAADNDLTIKLDNIYFNDCTDNYYTGSFNKTVNDYGVLWSDFFGYAEITKFKKEKVSFNKIGDSIVDLLKYKNEKYGKSALNPIEIFNGKTKVGQRLDDKISRIKNSDTLRKNDVADVIGYLFLVCEENNWTDFSEFKD